MFGIKVETLTLDNINGISANQKLAAIAISIIMFSMIGIPPFAGFFAKYYIFYQAIKNREFALAAVGLITSVIAAFYYLKVIKHIYFVKPKEHQARSLPFAISIEYGISFVIYSCLFVLICFAFFANIYI